MASKNLAKAASNQISNGVNRTTHLVNAMSDALTLALNTTDKLSTIDRNHFLGGKLANASTIFLNATSTVVASILNTKLNALNAVIATKTNIATGMLHISSNFVNKTGRLLSKLSKSSSPLFAPGRRSKAAEKLLNASINLVNVTGQSLANVINATSVLLTKSVDDHTRFVAHLLNSTAHLLNSTTNSIGDLLNTTNYLILGVVTRQVNTSSRILNQTADLLTASSKSVSSFLNATTLVIQNAANSGLSGNGHNFTLSAVTIAHKALRTIFKTTASLLQRVISTKKNISLYLITATGAFLNASVQIQTALLNAGLGLGQNITKSTAHLIASKLNSTANKIVNHFNNPPLLASTPINDEVIGTSSSPIDAVETTSPKDTFSSLDNGTTTISNDTKTSSTSTEKPTEIPTEKPTTEATKTRETAETTQINSQSTIAPVGNKSNNVP